MEISSWWLETLAKGMAEMNSSACILLSLWNEIGLIRAETGILSYLEKQDTSIATSTHSNTNPSVLWEEEDWWCQSDCIIWYHLPTCHLQIWWNTRHSQFFSCSTTPNRNPKPRPSWASDFLKASLVPSPGRWWTSTAQHESPPFALPSPATLEPLPQNLRMWKVPKVNRSFNPS